MQSLSWLHMKPPSNARSEGSRYPQSIYVIEQKFYYVTPVLCSLPRRGVCGWLCRCCDGYSQLSSHAGRALVYLHHYSHWHQCNCIIHGSLLRAAGGSDQKFIATEDSGPRSPFIYSINAYKRISATTLLQTTVSIQVAE